MDVTQQNRWVGQNTGQVELEFYYLGVEKTFSQRRSVVLLMAALKKINHMWKNEELGMWKGNNLEIIANQLIKTID